MDVASLIVAVIAVLISGAIAVLQLVLQRRVTAIEEARRGEEVAGRRVAQVTAAVERRPKHNRTQACLVLRNAGPAVARNVEFDPGSFLATRVIRAEELPIPALASGGESVFPLGVTNQTPLSVTFSARWEDDSGSREEQFTVSTM